jgi:hypothetical protein
MISMPLLFVVVSENDKDPRFAGYRQRPPNS